MKIIRDVTQVDPEIIVLKLRREHDFKNFLFHPARSLRRMYAENIIVKKRFYLHFSKLVTVAETSTYTQRIIGIQQS